MCLLCAICTSRYYNFGVQIKQQEGGSFIIGHYFKNTNQVERASHFIFTYQGSISLTHRLLKQQKSTPDSFCLCFDSSRLVFGSAPLQLQAAARPYAFTKNTTIFSIQPMLTDVRRLSGCFSVCYFSLYKRHLINLAASRSLKRSVLHRLAAIWLDLACLFSEF